MAALELRAYCRYLAGRSTSSYLSEFCANVLAQYMKLNLSMPLLRATEPKPAFQA
jgi:hypothetical protein